MEERAVVEFSIITSEKDVFLRVPLGLTYGEVYDAIMEIRQYIIEKMKNSVNPPENKSKEGSPELEEKACTE